MLSFLKDYEKCPDSTIDLTLSSYNKRWMINDPSSNMPSWKNLRIIFMVNDCKVNEENEKGCKFYGIAHTIIFIVEINWVGCVKY